jgi:L-threonylcarbamoyladenylate synthase
VGIESTVIDLTTFPKPTLLRPGHVSLAQLEAVIGPVAFEHRYVSGERGHSSQGESGVMRPGHASPGLAALHYAPTTPAYRFQREDYPRVIARLGSSGDVELDEERGPDVGSVSLPAGDGAAIVMLLSKAAIPSPHDVMPMPGTPEGYARMLYASLRSADGGGYRSIYVELPPDTPEWLAVRDRLLRATRPLA